MTERPSAPSRPIVRAPIRAAVKTAIRVALTAALAALVVGGASTCGGAGQAIPTAVEIDWPDAAPSAPAPAPAAAPTDADAADAGPAAQQ